MNVLERLRGGLIVSVQAPAGSPLDDPHVIAAMAAAAAGAGAVGVRIQGEANLKAVRERVRMPIVGIIKRAYAGFEPYITAGPREVNEVLACGAEIVACDATGRSRPGGASFKELVQIIHAGGALAMADCAELADGQAARAAGADILATTLCGYTSATQGTALPALDLVRALRLPDVFVICEGGIATPAQAAAAGEAGADAVVVGTAITGLESLVRGFAGWHKPKSSPA